jgi:hypothetical protein
MVESVEDVRKWSEKGWTKNAAGGNGARRPASGGASELSVR